MFGSGSIIAEADPRIRIRIEMKRIRNIDNHCQVVYYSQVLYPTIYMILLQEGPQCGLVALCMATRMLIKDSNISTREIFKMAAEKGYTKVRTNRTHCRNCSGKWVELDKYKPTYIISILYIEEEKNISRIIIKIFWS